MPLRVDEELPVYEVVQHLSGRIRAAGSDTLVNTIELWARQFDVYYPDVEFEIEGRGSATAPEALAKGKAEVAQMSREMTADELALFENEFGYPPTGVAVAIDGVAVFVHKDNPLEQLTLPQVDAIFSTSRECGYPGRIDRWGQLLEGVEWAQEPIEMYGRDELSGMYGYFKSEALCGGEFHSDVFKIPGSAGVVRKVANNEFAIGYSGIAYRDDGVKAVALARAKGQPYYTWQTARFATTNYPLSRRMYVYFNKPPDEPLSPLVREFVTFGLSREGQELVLKDGYVPLPAEVAALELEKLR